VVFALLTLAVAALVEKRASDKAVIVAAMVAVYGIVSYLLGYRSRL